MSSDDPGEHATPRRRELVLPEDPSEEELARNWTLTEADHAQVARCRGDDNRRRFALQICVLRQYGRFLEDYSHIPVRILNHLNRQIPLPPALSVRAPERNATEIEHRERIRAHLGFRTFDAAERTALEELLRSRVVTGALSSDLIESAQDAPRLWLDAAAVSEGGSGVRGDRSEPATRHGHPGTAFGRTCSLDIRAPARGRGTFDFRVRVSHGRRRRRQAPRAAAKYENLPPDPPRQPAARRRSGVLGVLCADLAGRGTVILANVVVGDREIDFVASEANAPLSAVRLRRRR
jgi:Domain of unknown function (DUF4158)